MMEPKLHITYGDEPDMDLIPERSLWNAVILRAHNDAKRVRPDTITGAREALANGETFTESNNPTPGQRLINNIIKAQDALMFAKSSWCSVVCEWAGKDPVTVLSTIASHLRAVGCPERGF